MCGIYSGSKSWRGASAASCQNLRTAPTILDSNPSGHPASRHSRNIDAPYVAAPLAHHRRQTKHQGKKLLDARKPSLEGKKRSSPSTSNSLSVARDRTPEFVSVVESTRAPRTSNTQPQRSPSSGERRGRPAKTIVKSPKEHQGKLEDELNRGKPKKDFGLI